MIRRRILLGALLAVLFAVGWWVGRPRASGDLYTNLDLFVEVLHAVQTSYVDPVQPQSLVTGGMRGMVKGLDPWSQYLDEREYANLQSTLAGSFDGIGAVVDEHEGYPVVIAPIEGSPAWEAGLRPGDVILRIDGHGTFGLGMPEVSARLHGAPGTRAVLTLAREGETEERDVTIERRRVETKGVPVAFIAAPGVGYLRLANFSERSGAEVHAALDSLRGAGARSLVLDLRGNPGGLVDQAVEIAQRFVPEGSLLVSTKGRSPGVEHRFVATKNQPELSWPMAVLIDGGSASASEIVAGALQDLDRAIVVGSASFGKGSVQNIYPLRGRAGALKLTTALYYTPSGRSIHRARKDALPADEGDDDPSDSTVSTPATPARPEFHTRAGRVVFGGGGITPDVEALPDSLPPLVRTLDERRIAYRFVGRWVAAHGPGTAIESAEWLAFERDAREQGVSATDAEFTRDREPLERLLRREHARRSGGAGAAARIALERDAAFQRALGILKRAHGARDVFAAATPARETPSTRGAR